MFPTEAEVRTKDRELYKEHAASPRNQQGTFRMISAGIKMRLVRKSETARERRRVLVGECSCLQRHTEHHHTNKMVLNNWRTIMWAITIKCLWLWNDKKVIQRINNQHLVTVQAWIELYQTREWVYLCLKWETAMMTSRFRATVRKEMENSIIWTSTASADKEAGFLQDMFRNWGKQKSAPSWNSIFSETNSASALS